MSLVRETAEELIRFIEKSPTAFHAVAELEAMLQGAGFLKLSELESWDLRTGGSYYVTRNDSSLIAFRMPEEKRIRGLQIIAGHSDSPSFKIKENPEMKAGNVYVKLNVEKYGGMLCAPWFDRPLSAAGRIIAEQDGRLISRLVNVDRDLLLIPNLAIHMNRKANDGVAYNVQKDLLPLYGMCGEGPSFLQTVAETAGVAAESLRGMDLFLYNREKGTVWGAGDCFLSAPRLDDLECVYGAARGLMAAGPGKHLQLCCVFDNEEVGSGTKQGAASTFLRDTIGRILSASGQKEKDRAGLLARSFMISADNAHALHPNAPDTSDPVNRPVINGGIVIKHSANQKYTTDGVSAALMRMLLKKAGLPWQDFLNRSDMAGGSTLGNISNTQVSLNTVDIGLAQLAMHSPYETAGTRDLQDLITAARHFYETSLDYASDGSFGWE